MRKSEQRIMRQLWAIIRYLVSYFSGMLTATIVGKIPSEARLPLIPVNPIVLAVLFFTGIMIWRLLPSFRNSKSTFAIATVMGSIYVIIIYLIAVDTPRAVVFNTEIVAYLTLLTYTLAVLQFLLKQPIVSFQSSSAEQTQLFLEQPLCGFRLSSLRY